MRARFLVGVALVVATVAPAGCSDRQPKVGEARLEVDGLAIVDRRSGTRETITDRTDVRSGERVEISKGTGRMVLRDGNRLELRAGVGDAANTMVVMAPTPVLQAGDLLVTAPRALKVSAAGTILDIEAGAAQVSRSLGMGVAAYDGMVHLSSAGVTRDVPALREMQVPALGRPPRSPRPLDYRASDPWDRRFLGEAIDLGRTLEALANGYTQNLNPGEGRTPGFFRIVLPGLATQPEFGADLIDVTKPPGETLIGAAITDLGRRGGFVDRWHAVFGFRDQGAEWGLVALDQAVSGTPLLGAIEQAVTFSPLTFAAPSGRRPGAVPGGGGGSTTTTVPTTPTTTTPTTTPPTTPPPTTPPITLPPNPLTPVLEPILGPTGEAVSGLVDGLLGALTG